MKRRLFIAAVLGAKLFLAQVAQAQARAYGAGLLTSNDAAFAVIKEKTELLAAQERARREASASTAGGFIAGLTEYDFLL